MAKKSAAPKKRPNPNTNNPNEDVPSKTPKSNQVSSAGSDPVRIVKTVHPQKSPKDSNDYRVITLSNKIKIALISRKESPHVDNTSYSGTSSNATYTVAKSPSPTIQPFRWPPLQHHATPACHFIDPRLAPWYHHQTPLCQFISTPPAGCRSDYNRSVFGNPIDEIRTIHANGSSGNLCETTSVAVVVNAGGLNDYENCEGLHHFTEHMVHYGSVKFPEEDAVNCIVANFGKYNATTFPHTTCYYNEVPDIVLENNLERFSDMLAQPIFNADVMKREVHAVDNEFYLRLPPFRKLLLQSHAIIESKSHPQARFVCGTLKTLRGGNVQNEMKTNHETNYVASAMTVSLNSTKSLDDLQELALRYFSNFVEGDRTTLVNTPEDVTLEPLTFHESKTVYLQGLTSVSELTFVWPFPATSAWMKSKQEGPLIPMIIRLLSDDSPGGLSHFLRSQEYIWGMLVYQSQMSSRYTTMLEITFLLTEKGRQNAKAIEHATFEYIRFLQKCPNAHLERLFSEMKIMNLKMFNYGCQSMASWECTQDFAMRLQLENDERKLLAGQSWMEAKLNLARFHEALKELLTADNFLAAQTVPRNESVRDVIPNATVKTAPHTNAEYVEELRDGDSTQMALPPQTFDFLAKNSYLSPDYDLMIRHNNVGSGDSYALKCPENCGDIQPQGLQYHSRCDTLKGKVFPKISGAHHGHQKYGHDSFSSSIAVRFMSPILLNPDSTTTALIYLWAFMTLQKLSPYRSEWEAAGFQAWVQPLPGPESMIVVIKGFPRDIERVLETAVEAMMLEDEKSGSELLPTELAFNLAKYQFKFMWEHHFSETENISDYLVECCTYDNSEISSVDILGMIDTITLEDLQMFMSTFKQSCFSHVDLHGNLPVKLFEKVANLLERMPYEPLWSNDPTFYSSLYSPLNPSVLVPGETVVRVKNLASYAYTTQVTNVYILGPYGPDYKDASLFEAVMYFMNCQAFMDLRTRQQLGYSVYVRKLNQPKARVQMMMFSVSVTATASKHTACELNQKIDQFLEDYKSYLDNMPEDLFQTRLKLACSPFPPVKKAKVAAWFRAKIPENFGKPEIKFKCLAAGIKKQSIQIISGNVESKLKECPCIHCANITEWKEGSSEGSKLIFAKGNGFYGKYYVSSHKF